MLSVSFQQRFEEPSCQLKFFWTTDPHSRYGKRIIKICNILWGCPTGQKLLSLIMDGPNTVYMRKSIEWSYVTYSDDDNNCKFQIIQCDLNSSHPFIDESYTQRIGPKDNNYELSFKQWFFSYNAVQFARSAIYAMYGQHNNIHDAKKRVHASYQQMRAVKGFPGINSITEWRICQELGMPIRASHSPSPSRVKLSPLDEERYLQILIRTQFECFPPRQTTGNSEDFKQTNFCSSDYITTMHENAESFVPLTFRIIESNGKKRVHYTTQLTAQTENTILSALMSEPLYIKDRENFHL